jgi:hypothetical protein
MLVLQLLIAGIYGGDAPTGTLGRFNGGKSQLQSEVQQLDVGNGNHEVAANHDPRIEKTVEQFEYGVFFVPIESNVACRVACHGDSFQTIFPTPGIMAERL